MNRTREEILNQPYTPAEEDWAKDQRFEEMGAIQMLQPSPRRSRYFREETAADHLAEIERENVEASQNKGRS